MIRCGVDIGGTFTDVVLDHPGGRSTTKVLTDYARPEAAILEGIGRVAGAAGVPLAAIGQVIHGTTLVTNALIQRSGPRTAFVTTEGFRDVIEMRSENRFEQYDLNLRLPEPLVPRKDRFTLAERMSPEGDVLLALDAGAVEALVARIVTEGFATVAVGFLHSYANDAHERMVAEAFARAAPELPVSISSQVSPQMRELPRFNTVIANAYVRPQVADYLGRLVEALRDAGVPGAVYMMHSGGGLISVETASREPVRLLESGPAGGAIFAAGYARAFGLDKALSFDMGGTTAKICLIEDGAPKTASSFEIARTYRFKKGSGMVVSTPVVEMVEIGAGGGSIASVDALGRIQVGPRSAGSEPGPACYGRGGEEPTVTDANLMLGRLDAANFAGGKIPLNAGASEAALRSRIGEVQGISAGDAGFGVTEMVDEQMANAARVHTVENGREIERFTMVAFGGGAPLHAARLAEKLGIGAVLIPPGAGVGSAIGFLEAPFSYETARGLYQSLEAFDSEAVNAAIAAMEEEARGFVEAGAGGEAREVRLVAHMRYAGQGWEIPVVLSETRFGDGAGQELRLGFEEAYRMLFGRIIEGLAVEVTNWTVSVASPRPERAAVARRDDGVATTGKTRDFFDAALRRHVGATEVERSDLSPGDRVSGPAVVVEEETTTIVTSAFDVIAQDDGSLLLVRKGDAA